MGWDIWPSLQGGRRAILDTGAERTDESGSSVADVFTGADMGGTAVGAPALPAGVAQHAQKMQALHRTRRKQAYALLVKNISCKDIKFHLRENFFQQGEQAWQYLCSIGDMEPQRSDVRAHDAAWAKISIGADIGISAFTVTKLHSLLRRVNAERPPTHRHDENEIAVRLLECINENAKLFGAESLSPRSIAPGLTTGTSGLPAPLQASVESLLQSLPDVTSPDSSRTIPPTGRTRLRTATSARSSCRPPVGGGPPLRASGCQPRRRLLPCKSRPCKWSTSVPLFRVAPSPPPPSVSSAALTSTSAIAQSSVTVAQSTVA